MKAVLLTLAIIFSVSTSVFSQNRDKLIYSQISEQSKEFIIMDKSKKPQKKIVHHFDQAESKTGRSVYGWDNSKGWVSKQKVEYKYGADGQLAVAVYTEWDVVADRWSKESRNLQYAYDSHGNLLTVKEVKIDNTMLFADK